ncbi:tektin [Culex quinquefasciatus]|uniref:Tektin n=2 Tax=Culex pipiens complex TaxID=518105 RepID=B0X6Z4_CULQU|nr:tektin-B1 [Culex quinquefasciatus]XP_039450640.1 tektin-B1 [Culex pipiens pallens]EDS41665.1 tektin [Culex quinquefasciatus]|eukprot:XP_001865416.1 tektin [Culex quinquefasciatus]
MSNRAVATFEKPLQHLSLPDWHSRLTTLKNVAYTKRSDAFELRHDARNLRNETRIQSYWDTYHNNDKLSDRVAELDRWRETMRILLKRVNTEIGDLKEEKACTERDLDALITPLTVVTDSISMRDCRLGSELTYDEGDTELKNELCIVENNQRLLRDQNQGAWEQLNRLQEVKFKLELDLTDKDEAQDIDQHQLDVDKHCANVTFKTEPTRVPKNSCTYANWLEYCEELVQLSEKTMADSAAVRESLFATREKARNILKAQQDRTSHTLRKRIFETQRARNELEYQQGKMKEEMQKCAAEIETLEQASNDKMEALKVVETRLENRAQRSGMELCIDESYHGLCDEVQKLRDTIKVLREKINAAKTMYNNLHELAKKVDQDLENKEHSLMTDIRSLDLRARLNTGEFGGKSTQTDRNIHLSRLEDEIPKS